jgi:hypothetical protein
MPAGVVTTKWIDDALLPGAHVAVFSETVDAAIEGRLRGLELRDTILVLRAGPRSGYIFLFRAPFEKSTVAEQVLATGTGGLHIEVGRVATVDSLNGGAYLGSVRRRDNYSSTDKDAEASLTRLRRGIGEFVQPSGRWPSNVLLVHGPECKNLGTKQVKGTNPMGPSPGNKRGVGFGHKGGIGADTREYVDDNGLETVASWECEKSCPVKILDDLSGERPVSGAAMLGKTFEASSQGYGGWGNSPRELPNDSGGASRFYPQFANERELVSWVERLITPV